ncbi:hypothetical protein L596_004371 [Steinernema carpocapsae]|uniref:Uncharacterized protein n=1 Tax=Steinernema carpocapsae TaxID=34508 RepID=A0A4U8UZ65_STECR|nr:hypothetical protein L596_004371 [Steinernema carpocapsae]
MLSFPCTTDHSVNRPITARIFMTKSTSDRSGSSRSLGGFVCAAASIHRFRNKGFGFIYMQPKSNETLQTKKYHTAASSGLDEDVEDRKKKDYRCVDRLKDAFRAFVLNESS